MIDVEKPDIVHQTHSHAATSCNLMNCTTRNQLVSSQYIGITNWVLHQLITLASLLFPQKS